MAVEVDVAEVRHAIQEQLSRSRATRCAAPSPSCRRGSASVRLALTNSTATGGIVWSSASSAASPTWTSPLSTTTFGHLELADQAEHAPALLRIAVPLVVVRAGAVSIDELDLDQRPAGGLRQRVVPGPGHHRRVAEQAPASAWTPGAPRTATIFWSAPSALRPSRESAGGGTGSSRMVLVSSRNSSASEPELHGAVDALRIRRVRPADREPLLAGAERGGPAIRPRSVALRLVLGRAVAPGAVGELVVVDGRDERVRRAHGLDVRVAPVLGIPGPVVVEGAALVRVARTAARCPCSRVWLAGGVCDAS